MKLIKGAVLFNAVRGAWVVYYSYLAKPFVDREPEEDAFMTWGLAMNAYRERDRKNRERLLRIRNRATFARELMGV